MYQDTSTRSLCPWHALLIPRFSSHATRTKDLEDFKNTLIDQMHAFSSVQTSVACIEPVLEFAPQVELEAFAIELRENCIIAAVPAQLRYSGAR